MQGFPPPKGKLVTKANWVLPPYNRYAFQHTRNLFPTVILKGAEKPAGQFPMKPVELLSGKKIEGIDGKPVSLDDFLQQTYTDGFLVLHQGHIVHESYWNGMKPDSPHLLFSITKSFTGALIGLYADRGLIDYNKTVADYVPELKESGFGDATIRQMMDMQVGVDWNESPLALLNPNSTFLRYGRALGLAPSGQISSAYKVLPTMKKSGPHGQKFQYVAPVADVLGWLLEKVSGKSYQRLLCDEILSRTALEGEGYLLVDSWGKALCTGGLNMTARDLARFGLMIQQGGRINGKRVVSEEFIRDCRFGGDKAAYKRGRKDSAWFPGGAYRNQWWVSGGESPYLMAVGIHGQHLFIDLERQVVIVRVSSTPRSQERYDRLFPPLYERIATSLSGK